MVFDPITKIREKSGEPKRGHRTGFEVTEIKFFMDKVTPSKQPWWKRKLSSPTNNSPPSSPPSSPPPPPPPKNSHGIFPGVNRAPSCQPPLSEPLSPATLRQIEKQVLSRSKALANKQKEQKKRDEHNISGKDVWLQKILPNWCQYQNSKLVKKLCVKGIPSAARTAAWPLLMGNKLQITPELQEIFYNHALDFEREDNKIRHGIEAAARLRSSQNTKRMAMHEKFVKEAKEEAAEEEAAEEEAAEEEAEAKDGKESGKESEKSDGKSDGKSDRKSDRIVGEEISSATTTCSETTNESLSMSSDSSSAEEDPQRLGKRKSLHYIEVDLPRTFPQLSFFKDGSPMQDDLKKLLMSYAFYRPDVGYIQGMSYIAAVLLLYMDVHSAFSCFANLLSSHFYFDFFRLDPQKINGHLSVYDALFHETIPKLFVHFQNEEILSEMYMIDWLLTLYSRSMPIDIAARVWDLYLCEGEMSLFRVAIGILLMHCDMLMRLDMSGILHFLHNIPEDMSEHILFDTYVAKVDFNKKHFNKIYQKLSQKKQ